MTELLHNLSFQTPWAMAALLLLPVIWWLLRFIPPRPKQVQFPPTRILLDLQKKQETPDKMPWWLLLLRLLMTATLIIGVAHILFSSGSLLGRQTHNMLLVVDDGWASAKNWTQRQDYIITLLDDAQRNNVAVSLATTSPRQGAVAIATQPASVVADKVRALKPRALAPDRAKLGAALQKAGNLVADQIVWISDGLNDADAQGFAKSLTDIFPDASRLIVVPGKAELPVALTNARLAGADIKVDLLAPTTDKQKVAVQARAADGHVLAETAADIGGTGTATLSLPLELRNDVQSLVIAGQDHAAARLLLDDRWRRKTVALLSGESIEEQQPLLSPLHYVTRALEPYAELSVAPSAQDVKHALDAGLSMLVLADIGAVSDNVHDDIAKWVEGGGLLVRFAGPHLAAGKDDLVPVRLREGGRQLGSALSWETPQGLQAFAAKTPFDGIPMDDKVTVSKQVLAEPDATLADNTWASLADGTPLVTAAKRGKGLIVLFHTTANTDWSNLPLSGAFAEIMRRLVDIAPAAGSTKTVEGAGTLQADQFAPKLMLSGTGDLMLPEPEAKPIAAKDFDKTRASADAMPGLYARGGLERAINVEARPEQLVPIENLGSSFTQSGFSPPDSFSLAGRFFIAAFLMFLLDSLASLWVGGALGRKRAALAAALFAVFLLPLSPDTVRADPTEADMQAALQTRLAFVKTGDADVDQTSGQGLKGLSLLLGDRTSAHLGDAVGIDIEKDDLVFYPLLYWPVVETAPEPSPAALAKIDIYMKNGGTIFFDLRDDGFGSDSLQGGQSAGSQALQRIIGKLNIPALEPVAEQHVLTRSFYLLTDFPGRYANGKLWVQAGGSGNAEDPGTADGVSPIIIGSNDYAAAWAMDDAFAPLYSVSGGDDRQREFAFRTGINIVMYALTGNYKADQVHIPALLERLGQ
jgi:hypothetical protein